MSRRSNPAPSRRRFLAMLGAALPTMVVTRAFAQPGGGAIQTSAGTAVPPGAARAAIAAATATDNVEWQSLFDGKTLGQWKPTVFGGEGKVTVEDARIVLETGSDLTGITWAGPALPTVDYEIALSAMRLSGSDFFCGLTFPVRADFCSFIVGGWSGTVIGLSNLDLMDASENETSVSRVLDDKRWYAIRVRVTADTIQAWIDDEQLVSVTTTGRKIGIRPEVSDSRPLGITSYRTRAALRDIRVRRL